LSSASEFDATDPVLVVRLAQKSTDFGGRNSRSLSAKLLKEKRLVKALCLPEFQPPCFRRMGIIGILEHLSSGASQFFHTPFFPVMLTQSAP
jgi:hypothetical protein